MSASRSLTRRLAAAIGAASLSLTGLGAVVALSAPGIATAAVPDQWGFAYVSKPAVPGTPDAQHQAGSWPGPFMVTTKPGVVGQVIVRFPKIASKGGVVHVTADDGRAVWCQAQKWGPSGSDEIAIVRCFRASAGPAVPVFAPFTVMFTRSSKAPVPAGRAYGYVHFQPGPGVVARFNSAGAVNTVAAGPVGVWVVTMPGLGSAVQSGGVQVTAVDPAGPAKCELGGWAWSAGAQRFQVRCFNGMTTPLSSGWTLTYQRKRAVTGGQPKHFAYTLDNKPLIAGPYAPAPPSVNFNSVAAVNTIRSAGAGLRLVQFPSVGVLPNNVLVSAFKVGPGFCNLVTLWATTFGAPNVIVRDVACYTAAGVLKSQPSLVTYMSSK
jgi:hypothetical protein